MKIIKTDPTLGQKKEFKTADWHEEEDRVHPTTLLASSPSLYHNTSRQYGSLRLPWLCYVIMNVPLGLNNCYNNKTDYYR